MTRRLYTTTELAGFLSWDHLQTVVRVQSEKRDIETDRVLEQGNRYFVCSLKRDALCDEQWLLVVRNHWWVENGTHQVWDKIFDEDAKPWIRSGEGAGQGTVVVMLLRRLAHNLLALFRSVTQRSEDKRQMPWKDLIRKVYNTLIAATDADIEALRPRARRCFIPQRPGRGARTGAPLTASVA